MKPVLFKLSSFVAGAIALSLGLAVSPSTANAQASAHAAGIDHDLPENWADQPRLPGDWRYVQEPGETFALYANGPQEMHAIVRCDLGSRKVGIGLFGVSAQSASMEIHTETMSRTLHASARQSAEPLLAAELTAHDRVLDAMAVTHGNFAIRVPGERIVYLPGWAEVTRVIEDCR